ncbi:MAG TPA: GNAT family N-acetyltransferase [Anaerolineales bacterium]
MNRSISVQPIPRDLGDGLILRRSSPADADALADFCSRVHSEHGMDKPDHRIAAWTRDLLTKPHPTFHADDFTVVEESATGRIVSTLNLISQTWAYEGIPFGVGRPELVGTLPEYRKRGLVRLQFDEVHRWSAARGEMVQAITGIPFYYRQFGYEMALDLAGRRFGYEAHVPKLKEGEAEAFRIRPAVEADLPFISALYDQAQRRYALTCVRTPEIWQYELNRQSEASDEYYGIHVIEELSGKFIGYLQHQNYLNSTALSALSYEISPEASWLEVTACVVRYLWSTGKAFAACDTREFNSFGFMLGAKHPAYEALGDRLPTVRDPYAWYMRVPDVPGFLNHIKPALEKRLAGSVGRQSSRELKLNFYRNGVRLVIDNGRILTIEAWAPAMLPDEGDASFPGLAFLLALFGYRSCTELKDFYADCFWEEEETGILLDCLFPKKLSDVFPIA